MSGTDESPLVGRIYARPPLSPGAPIVGKLRHGFGESNVSAAMSSDNSQPELPAIHAGTDLHAIVMLPLCQTVRIQCVVTSSHRAVQTLTIRHRVRAPGGTYFPQGDHLGSTYWVVRISLVVGGDLTTIPPPKASRPRPPVYAGVVAVLTRNGF